MLPVPQAAPPTGSLEGTVLRARILDIDILWSYISMSSQGEEAEARHMHPAKGFGIEARRLTFASVCASGKTIFNRFRDQERTHARERTWLVSCLPRAPVMPWFFSVLFIMASRFAAMRCLLSDMSRQYVPVGLPTKGPHACV